MAEPDPAAGIPPGPGSADPAAPTAADPSAPPGRAPTGSPATPGAPRSRARKVVIALAVVFVLAIGTAAALLPAVLSSEQVRSMVEAKVSAASGRKFTLGGLAVDWSSATLKSLEARYGPADGDPVLFRVAEIRVPGGIPLALKGRHDFGTVEVRGVELRLDAREARKAAKAREEAAASAGAGEKKAPKDGGEADPVPPFSAKVDVTDGAIVLVDLEGKERRFATFTAEASAASDGPAKVRLRLDMGTSGKALLELDAKPFVGGRPAPADSMEAAVSATAEALDLASLREVLVAATGLRIDELAGNVSAKADVRTLGSPGTAEGTVVFQGTGLVAAGADLGEGIRVEEPVLKLTAGFLKGSDGTTEVKDVALEMQGLHAKGSLSATKDGVLNGSLQANVSLEEMRVRAARLGRNAPRVLQGDLAIAVRATGDPKAQRVTGSLRAVDMHVGAGEGRLPVEEPEAVCEFDVVRIGKGFRIDVLSLKSSSALLEASGSGGEDGSLDVKAAAKVQLARVQRALAGFGLKVPGEFGGMADLEVRVLRAAAAAGAAAPAAESTATLRIRDFLAQPPGEGATLIREPLLEAGLVAVPGKDAVEIRSLTWKGAGADLRAAGSTAADGKSGALSTVEATLDLGKAAALAGSFGTPLPARLAGTAAWKGPVSWKDTFDAISIEGGTLDVRGLEAVLPAKDGAPERVLREESIRLSVGASVAKSAAGRDVTIAKAVLAAAGIDAAVSGTLAADGTMDLKAAGTLGIGDACRRAATARFLDRDPGTGGVLDFDVSVRGKPAAAEVAFDRLETRDAEFALRGTGRFAVGGAADANLDVAGDLGALLGLAARAGFGEPTKGAAGKASMRLSAKAAGPDAPLVLSLDGGVEGLRYPDSAGGPPWTLRSLAASTKATVDRKAESAAGELSVKTDDGTATARGSVAYAAGKRAFDATADIDIDLGGLCRSRPDLLPLEGMTVGRVKGTLAAKGPIAEPFDLAKVAATARLDLESVKTQPVELREASADFFLQNGTVATRNLTAKVNDGTVKGSAGLALVGREARHFVEFHAEGVRIDPAMAFVLRQVVPIFAVGETGGVSGALKIDLRLDGMGPTWNDVKPNLHGRGSLAVADGLVTGNGIVGEVLELLGGGKGFGFHVLSTEFDVRDRRVWNERLTVDGRDHSMVIRGSTTFDGKLDYRVGAKAIKASKKVREKLKDLADEEGNLPFQISGSLTKPKIRAPDLAKAIGNDLLDRLKGRLGDDDDEKDKDGKKREGKDKK